MNENIDLTKILKDCPKGFKLYSIIFGCVSFKEIIDSMKYPIVVSCQNGRTETFTANGKMFTDFDGGCVLFPSKDQRDWSKFTAPWLKKERFDPKTLKPFDKVLVCNGKWQCDFFSHMSEGEIFNKHCIGLGDKTVVIPYNNETKHLIGTKDEAPEYYKYWED